MQKVTADDVAKYIIEKRQNEKVEFPPNHLALQRLLYFLQRDWMHKTGKPLFDDDFEAWQFGPRIPSIYYKYRLWGTSPIRIWNEKPTILPLEVERFIDRKLDTYSELSHWDLVSKDTKRGSAWIKIWNDGEGDEYVIPKKLIRKEKALPEDFKEKE